MEYGIQFWLGPVLILFVIHSQPSVAHLIQRRIHRETINDNNNIIATTTTTTKINNEIATSLPSVENDDNLIQSTQHKQLNNQIDQIKPLNDQIAIETRPFSRYETVVPLNESTEIDDYVNKYTSIDFQNNVYDHQSTKSEHYSSFDPFDDRLSTPKTIHFDQRHQAIKDSIIDNVGSDESMTDDEHDTSTIDQIQPKIDYTHTKTIAVNDSETASSNRKQLVSEQRTQLNVERSYVSTKPFQIKDNELMETVTKSTRPRFSLRRQTPTTWVSSTLSSLDPIYDYTNSYLQKNNTNNKRGSSIETTTVVDETTTITADDEVTTKLQQDTTTELIIETTVQSNDSISQENQMVSVHLPYPSTTESSVDSTTENIETTSFSAQITTTINPPETTTVDDILLETMQTTSESDITTELTVETTTVPITEEYKTTTQEPINHTSSIDETTKSSTLSSTSDEDFADIRIKISTQQQPITTTRINLIDDNDIVRPILITSTISTVSSKHKPNENDIIKHTSIVHEVNTITNQETTVSDLSNGSSAIDMIESMDDDDTNPMTIAAIVIICIATVCLILLAVLLFIMRKRQKRFNYGQRCTPVSLDAYSLDSVSMYNSVRRKGALRASKRSYGNPAFEDTENISHPMSFSTLANFTTNIELINKEYDDIPVITAQTSDVPTGCESKNRYANVIPLAETRVYLTKIEGDPHSDYINANFVRGPKNTKAYYIATQAPLENTIDDFWRMIWEQQSQVIIQLTELYENGVEKCFDYLPPSEVLDCHRQFGDFQITLKKREVKEKYIIHNIQLKNMVSNSWREVAHFWYLGWPERGTPNEVDSMIAFLIETRSYTKAHHHSNNNTLNAGVTSQQVKESENNGHIITDTQPPIVVHCSPGTGRTGTVIACDILIREFELTRMIDVPKLIYRIRRDRASSVQTKDQYAYIYKVINAYATKFTSGALDSI